MRLLSEYAPLFRASVVVRLVVAAFVVAVAIPAAVDGQETTAAAVALTNTPSGAIPSVNAGALGSSRLSFGVRYGRLTDRYVIPADVDSEEGLETYDRDVYAAELSLGLMGGTMRVQGGRWHGRYRYERADTIALASPSGVLAGLGFARQIIGVGVGPARFGIGSDLSGGWSNYHGESAIAAHAQLPVSIRFLAGTNAVTAWGAPGIAWGTLYGESATISTSSAGLRLELPGGTALDLAGAQLVGEHDLVWGGARPRLSVGISHAFGARNERVHEDDPRGYRPRYSTTQPKTADSAAAGEAERARRTRPSTMPRETQVAQEQPREEAAPAPVNVAVAPPAAEPAPAPVREPARAAPPAAPARSIFYVDEGTPAPPAAKPAPAPTPAARPAPTPAPTRAATPASRRSQFTVQAAAVKTAAEADSVRAELVAAGFHARIIQGPDWYRIRVGRFTTRGDAEAFATNMRKQRFEAWVTAAEEGS